MNTAISLTSITTGGTLSAFAGHPNLAFCAFVLATIVALASIRRFAVRDRHDHEAVKQIIQESQVGSCTLEQFAEIVKSRGKSPPQRAD